VLAAAPPAECAGAIADSQLAVCVRCSYNETYGDDEVGTDGGTPGFDHLTPRAFAEAIANEHAQGDLQYEDLMREIIGVQGALKTLVSKLQEAAHDVKLDVFATIAKLLQHSRRNQREFRDVDGYKLVENMFTGISDYSSEASRLFVRDVFKMLQIIIIDGSSEKLVGNLDALKLVLRLITAPLHLEVREGPREYFHFS
jgi:hypothetical protein